ncbi:ABC transporter ATP-binding protein [Pseudoxanthomonas winnipegensis]|uniref:ABC transporter ATP-binding protein n=1 Tax=Pseudoxanthomonas winnipegensis TaxID=2480810 RepID=UPI002575BFD3|nr:ABC transporter ATP-binding protein [Pseudoxanthomonas winnipegensis]WJI17535.1 ABC transporter ATP-binding protein [Pseudoxanthomonas winnipegensis]
MHGLNKTYRVFSRPHHRLLQSLNRKGAYFRDFTALDDVSFMIERGETVGIIGKNGSGKSTLLQIICGVLSPTAGEIQVNGRIAAILELGAGFNTEFTGRENVLLGASLLGMSDAEARAAMPEIVRFAELEDFIDQPVKTYSSGMYIRLAFSLAISVKPDILIVDEALAVGDEAFQRKCFGKIEHLKSQGCTLLFVSHSAGTVTYLCDRVILLDGGRRLLSGAPKQAVALYQRLLYAPKDKREAILEEIRAVDASGVLEAEVSEKSDPGTTTAIAAPEIELYDELNERFDAGLLTTSMVELVPRGARIENVRILNEARAPVNVLSPGQYYYVAYTVKFLDEGRNVNLGMMIKSIEGIELFGMTSNAVGDAFDAMPKGTACQVEFKFKNLFLPGTYFLNVGCHGIDKEGEPGFLHRILDAYMFKVESTASSRLVRGYYDLSEEPACAFKLVGSISECTL